jgi:hypothetical protein
MTVLLLTIALLIPFAWRKVDRTVRDYRARRGLRSWVRAQYRECRCKPSVPVRMRPRLLA